jgi:SAM-dependent methyltransferase
MPAEKPVCLSCGSGDLSPWAKATDREYFSTTDWFDYYICARCRAISIDPVPENRLQEIYPANYYSSTVGKPSCIERIKMANDRRLFRRILKPLKGDTLSALDIGGGTGWLLDQAKCVEPRLASTVVIDLDPTAAPAAKASGHAYFCGRVEDYVPDHPVDIILMLNLIEHVKDPVAVLKKMGVCLKPNGRILLKTPNHDSLDARLFCRTYWGGLHCPRHWVLFTPESLTAAVEKAGLYVREIRLTQGAPFWVWSVINLFARCGLVKISAKRPIDRHPLAPILSVIFAAFDFARRPFMRTSQMFAILSRSQDSRELLMPVERAKSFE